MKSLRVGFVVTHPFNGSPGSVQRVYELSRGLVKLGCEVHIYSPFRLQESLGERIHFHKIPSFFMNTSLDSVSYALTRRVYNNGFLSRNLALRRGFINRVISSLSKSLESTIKEDLDVLQGEQEIAATACLRLKDKLDVRVLSSFHNIWVEELMAMGIIKSSDLKYLELQHLEQEIVDGSEGIIVVSDEMKRYLLDTYSANPRSVFVVPPGGRLHNKRVCGFDPPFRLVYSGLVVKRANYELLLRSLPFILKELPRTKIYISRVGDDFHAAKRLAASIGLKPDYYWYRSSDDYYDFLASCHLGLVTSSDDLARRMGPPVKLFDYLSVGLPIVANDIGGWSKIVEKEGVGVLTKSDPENFSAMIVEFLKGTRLESCSKAAIECVKLRWSWDHSASTLLQAYS